MLWYAGRNRSQSAGAERRLPLAGGAGRDPGVSRSRVTRWLKGAGIDPLNAEKVDLLELVWSNLLRVYEPEAARMWLWGVNPALGDRRPIDLVRAGRAEELMRAIRAERADSFA